MSRLRLLALPRDLVIGPFLLVFASLLDLFVATRVFTHPDRLAASLAYFIFGAATGVPMQLLFGRLAARFDGEVGRSEAGGVDYDRKAAAAAGTLAAVATATWLYALNVADSSVAFALANLSPAIFAFIEVKNGSVRPERVVLPVLLLLTGMAAMRAPSISAVAATPVAVLLVLLARNLANAGAEHYEKVGAHGRISRFAAMRFVWLAGAGLPLALGVAIATGRIGTCLQLIADNFGVALAAHTMTMVLSFAGGYIRTRAKREVLMTLCTAAFSVPLVMTPAAATLINSLAHGFFPTVTGSLRMLLCVVLVVSGVTWLSIVCTTKKTTNEGGTP